MVKNEYCPFWTRGQGGQGKDASHISLLLLSIRLEVPGDMAERERTVAQPGKKASRFYPRQRGVYEEISLREATKQFLELLTESIKVTGYKVSIQQSAAVPLVVINNKT